MILHDDEFVTNAFDNGLWFAISIKQESDHSQDGGHTFEDVTHTFELDKGEAQNLLNELQDFINR